MDPAAGAVTAPESPPRSVAPAPAPPAPFEFRPFEGKAGFPADVSGFEISYTAERTDPKTYRGVRIEGDTGFAHDEPATREELTVALRGHAGGGKFKVRAQVRRGGVYVAQATEAFKIGGNPKLPEDEGGAPPPTFSVTPQPAPAPPPVDPWARALEALAPLAPLALKALERIANPPPPPAPAQLAPAPTNPIFDKFLSTAIDRVFTPTRPESPAVSRELEALRAEVERLGRVKKKVKPAKTTADLVAEIRDTSVLMTQIQALSKGSIKDEDIGQFIGRLFDRFKPSIERGADRLAAFGEEVTVKKLDGTKAAAPAAPTEAHTPPAGLTQADVDQFREWARKSFADASEVTDREKLRAVRARFPRLLEAYAGLKDEDGLIGFFGEVYGWTAAIQITRLDDESRAKLLERTGQIRQGLAALDAPPGAGAAVPPAAPAAPASVEPPAPPPEASGVSTPTEAPAPGAAA